MESLKSAHDKVAWLLEKVPATRSNYLLLILLYWQVFDGVDIPKEVVNAIVEHGTEPETISRAKRKIIEASINIDAYRAMIKEAMEDGEGTDKSKG